jgi:hypothetical protein
MENYNIGIPPFMPHIAENKEIAGMDWVVNDDFCSTVQCK